MHRLAPTIKNYPAPSVHRAVMGKLVCIKGDTLLRFCFSRGMSGRAMADRLSRSENEGEERSGWEQTVGI